MGTGHTPSRSEPAYWTDCEVPWLTTADVHRFRDDEITVIDDTELHVNELGLANSAAVVHPAGTVALSRTASAGFSVIMGQDMATSQDYATWTCGPRLDNRYLLWCLRGMRSDLLGRLAMGSTHKTIYFPDLMSLRIPLPPLEEQRRIADFLDDQAARTDQMMAAKTSQLSRLTELMRAYVHDAVTGSDLGGIQHPSGIPWAPEIPTHWRAPRLNQVSRIGTGHTPSRSIPTYWLDCDIPWLTTSDVYRFRGDDLDVLDRPELNISQLGLRSSSAVMHPAGTVALCRTSGSAGFSIIMGRDMATSQDYATWTCGPMLQNEYLLWCLRAMRADLMNRLAMGSTHKTIYFPDLLSVRVPLPPMSEQVAVVDRIQGVTHSVREAQRALGHSKDALGEFKQSLISAAVSGEFDVSSASGRGVPA